MEKKEHYKYTQLNRDKKGFYFYHPQGGKIRGKTMLKKFAKLTQCPEGVDLCIDKEGDIGIFAPKELKEDIVWDSFVAQLSLNAVINERHDNLQEACNGTHINVKKKATHQQHIT